MPDALKPFAHFIAAAVGVFTYALISIATGLLAEPPPRGRARTKLFVNALIGFVAGYPAALILGPAVAAWLHVTDDAVKLGIVYVVGVSFMRLLPIALTGLEKFVGKKLEG